MEDRGPEEIIHALSLRDHDEVRARCSTSLWPEIRSVDSAINFFLSLDQVLASAAGGNTTAESESSYVIGEHPYTAELVSENEVLFRFPHREPLTHGDSRSASQRAAQRLYSAACGQIRSSDRSTHVARRYATGEWTTVEVVGPEDLPPPTPLEAHVGSLIHQLDLTTWTLDEALPSRRPPSSS
ncbi:hypothetical protein [Streptomyces sp. enrichment culture]|uniref:hypothetical protein n=1 Tax=Streptomyces sp. enrichment culture TaxID=1795815 RepID=UPI003F5517F1